MRETEIKKQILPQDIDTYATIARDQGYKPDGQWTHIDIAFDTPENGLKQHNIILRLRHEIIGTKINVYLTLKLKISQSDPSILDNNEYEVNLSSETFDETIFHIIQKLVFLKTDNVFLVPDKLLDQDLEQITAYFYSLGLTSIRMALEKTRTQLSKQNSKLCFDTLPADIGTFIEIEENSPQDLSDTMSLFNIDANSTTRGNYGHISRLHATQLGKPHPQINVSPQTENWLLPILHNQPKTPPPLLPATDHLVIALVGRTGTGKTTALGLIKAILSQKNINHAEIDKLELYRPYFAQYGIKDPYQTNRYDLIQFFDHLYATEGKDIGTKLLEYYILTAPTDTVYLIDGKRSQAGLQRFKQHFPNGVLIHITAPIQFRAARHHARHKPMDRDTDIFETDQKMDTVFHEDESCPICDCSINNEHIDTFTESIHQLIASITHPLLHN